MKPILTAMIGVVCVAHAAHAREQATFKETGFAKERAILANNPVFANNVKSKVIDTYKIGIARLDVNGDGEKEIFAHDYNNFSCGSQGCSTYVFEKKGTQYLAILTMIAGDVIVVSDKSSHNNGYKDIYVKDGNGNPIRWSYNGSEYAFND